MDPLQVWLVIQLADSRFGVESVPGIIAMNINSNDVGFTII